VKACKGRVKLWSLGNEMGYGHMEGPNGAKGYAQMVLPHAEAMLKVDPSLTIVSSGPYPYGGDDWIENGAKVLAGVAPIVSYHRYDNPNGLESGCRFRRMPGTGKVVDGFYELTLDPANLACVRLGK